MVMTNEEIVRDYRLSKDPKEQIGILADRNMTTQDAIREVLLEAGVTVPAKRKSPEKRKNLKKKAVWDQNRAMELLAEGKTVREIADEVGASYSAVWEWRKRTGLQGNDGRKKPPDVAKGELPEKEPATDSAPLPEPETSAEDSPVIYRQIESILAALPKDIGEKARWAAGKLAAELFAEYLMERLGLREDEGV